MESIKREENSKEKNRIILLNLDSMSETMTKTNH